MPRIDAIICAAACLTLARPTTAQQPSVAVAPAAIAADPKDVASPDAIIAALYDVNSRMVDQKTGADRFRSLMVPDAHFSATIALSGMPARLNAQSTEQYIRSATSGQPRHGFSEREISRKTDAFGHIMQAFSTYETMRDSNDKAPLHGINSIQLFNDGTRWWVVGVLWDNERANSPIPQQYRPAAKPPR